MINWGRVDELKADIGAEDFAEVVEIFLEEVEETLGHIEDCADAAELEGKLHFLKGSALNLGFREFSDLCGHWEDAAANGAFRETPLPEIKESYARAKAAFLAAI